MAGNTYQNILDELNSPSEISAPGTYGEGQFQNILTKLQTAKGGVLGGKIKVSDYQAAVSSAVNYMTQRGGQISSGGSSAAKAINPLLQQLQDQGFVKQDGGKWTPQLGFSRNEWARVPQKMLPSQGDVDAGKFDPASVPFSRINQPTDPTTGKPIPSSLPGQININPTTGLPEYRVTTPAGIDLTGPRGQAELEAQRQSGELQNVLNAQQGVYGNITDRLNKFAEQQKGTRAQQLTDMATQLAQAQQTQFQSEIPMLAEQANTKGIFRSTGFGEMLANTAAGLEAQRQQQLAGFARQNDLSYNQDVQSGMNATTQGLQNYAGGLGDVVNTALGLQTGGLQRNYSLTDFTTQQQLAQQLMDKQLSSQGTKTSADKSAAWMQGGMGALSAGAKAASKGGTAGA